MKSDVEGVCEEEEDHSISVILPARGGARCRVRSVRVNNGMRQSSAWVAAVKRASLMTLLLGRLCAGDGGGELAQMPPENRAEQVR